ncbi:DUF1450 domain-containing protein [Paenibacillus aurantius]|uniref:DUF1450 domain-containing protein n=1 Tax=Paenibacillus aurantius TaxID=2918900 RepID=A0AA96RDC1_9BACL|nr:DUF1450 domain-containing protein [Paenibacillus aurantius]WNQ09657.1 DUF1450 domain-containing protein [Paenibacillus aurantius]
MEHLVEFCQSNLHVSGTKKVMDILRSKGGFKIKEYDCMGYCFDCSEKPYAVLNQKVLQEENVDDLINRIMESVDK